MVHLVDVNKALRMWHLNLITEKSSNPCDLPKFTENLQFSFSLARSKAKAADRIKILLLYILLLPHSNVKMFT